MRKELEKMYPWESSRIGHPLKITGDQRQGLDRGLGFRGKNSLSPRRLGG
jgi:hypothetical protein